MLAWLGSPVSGGKARAVVGLPARAAAVTSLILVATHDDEEPAASNTASVRVQVAPQLGRNQGGVMARISF